MIALETIRCFFEILLVLGFRMSQGVNLTDNTSTFLPQSSDTLATMHPVKTLASKPNLLPPSTSYSDKHNTTPTPGSLTPPRASSASPSDASAVPAIFRVGQTPSDVRHATNDTRTTLKENDGAVRDTEISDHVTNTGSNSADEFVGLLFPVSLNKSGLESKDIIEAKLFPLDYSMDEDLPAERNRQLSNQASNDSGITWMGLPQHECLSDMTCIDRCWEGDRSLYNMRNDDISLALSDLSFRCKCDEFCLLLGDCCQDYFEDCAGRAADDELYEYLNINNPKEKDDFYIDDDPDLALKTSFSLYRAFGKCQSIEYFMEPWQLFPSPSRNVIKTTTSMWVISKCPGDFWLESDDTTNDIVEQCEASPRDRLFSFPVHYRWEPGLIFRNVFCAICHDYYLNDVIFWDLLSHCQVYEEFLEVPERWSIDDIKNFFDYNSPCFINSGPVISLQAKPRVCMERPSYETTCIEDQLNGFQKGTNQSDYVRNLETLCTSYMKPLVINSVTYSNPHCALCGQVSDYDILHNSSCFKSYLSEYVEEILTPIAAKVFFFNGKIQSDIKVNGGYESFYYPLSAIECPDLPDPRNTYLGRCIKACTDDMPFEVSEISTPEEIRCLILSDYTYKGMYKTDIPSDQRGYTPVFIRLVDWKDAGHADIILKKLRELATEIHHRTSQCSPLSFCKIPVFQVMGVEPAGHIHIQWPLDVSYYEIFKMTVLLFKEMKDNREANFDDLIFFRNYNFIEEVCSHEDRLTFYNVPLIRYQTDLYFWIPNINCLFPLKNVGFQIQLHYPLGLPFEANVIVMCWTYDLQLYCGLQQQNFLNPLPPLPDKNTGTTQVSTTDERNVIKTTTDSSSPTKQKPSTDRPFGAVKTNGGYSDILTFKTVCFTTCACFSFLSLLIDCTSRSKTEVCVVASVLALCLQMVLFLIAENISGVDNYALGYSAHFCWILLPILVCTSIFLKNVDVDDTAEENLANYNFQQTPKTQSQTKIILSNVALALVIVIVCLVLDAEKSISLDIGYSSNSGHVFWMTNELACYISLIGVSTLLYSAATIILCVKIIMARRHVEQRHGQDPRSRAGTMWNTHFGRAGQKKIMHTIYVFLMFVWAVCDYVDNRRGLWSLVFCSFAFAYGLHSLHCSLVYLVTQKKVKSLNTTAAYDDNYLESDTRTEGDGVVSVTVSDANDSSSK